MRATFLAAAAVFALSACSGPRGTMADTTATSAETTSPATTGTPTSSDPAAEKLLDVNAAYVALLDHAARTGTEPVTITAIREAFPTAKVVASDTDKDDRADDFFVTISDKTGTWCLIVPDQQTGRAGGTAPGGCQVTPEADE